MVNNSSLRRRNALRSLDVSEEEPPRVVWQMAWPAVLTMLLQLTNGLVDMFFVGRLGPAAQAAVGMGNQVVMLLSAAAMAVTSGATAIVARYEVIRADEDCCRARLL